MNLGRARHVASVLAGVVGREIISELGERRGAASSTAGLGGQRRAVAVRHALEQLGPFYIKMGQVLSTRPDIVPETMIQEFQNLHERVAVAPFSDFEPVLEDEIGRDWRNVFAEIDTETPLGAASLAQVYAVRLKSGEPAVVKIQRPGTAKVMRDDMGVIRSAARQLARRRPDLNEVLDLEAMLEGIFNAMEPELNFNLEAANMEQARGFLDGFEHIAVPEPIFVTERVLVQQMAPGRSIREVNRDKIADDERQAIGRELLAFMYRGFWINGMFHADPHPGNVYIQPGGQAFIIDWGMVGRLDRRMSLATAMVVVNLAQNDGMGLAKAWIEMGRATSWANIPGFINDLSAFVPTVAGASMKDFNFGATLTQVLKFSTRRGIQTPPAIGLLGKAFANIEGSVRYLAPELSLIDVFQDEFEDVVFTLARHVVSDEHAAQVVMNLLAGITAAPEQSRSLLRDLSNRELTIQVSEAIPRRSRREDRADQRARAMRHTIAALGIIALWHDRRSRQPR